ncbi:hypothetical protein FB451DRAFT_1368750 [Mycena latifolia]|nr:hypothetical protein FB451DRAFT_1368750 [Mycena latifolia]
MRMAIHTFPIFLRCGGGAPLAVILHFLRPPVVLTFTSLPTAHSLARGSSLDGRPPGFLAFPSFPSLDSIALIVQLLKNTATHFHFIREIPMFVPYEVRANVGAWDDKWRAMHRERRFRARGATLIFLRASAGSQALQHEMLIRPPDIGRLGPASKKSNKPKSRSDKSGTPSQVPTPAGAAEVIARDSTAQALLARAGAQTEPDGTVLYCASASFLARSVFPSLSGRGRSAADFLFVCSFGRRLAGRNGCEMFRARWLREMSRSAAFVRGALELWSRGEQARWNRTTFVHEPHEFAPAAGLIRFSSPTSRRDEERQRSER